MKSQELIKTVVLAGAIFVLGYLAILRTDRYLFLKGINDCATAATVEWQNADGATIIEPFSPVYEECLNDKEVKLNSSQQQR